MGHQIYSYNTIETPSFKKWWKTQSPSNGTDRVITKTYGVSDAVTERDMNKFILDATEDVDQKDEKSKFFDLECPPNYSVVAYNIGPSKSNPDNNVYVYSFDVGDTGQNPWDDDYEDDDNWDSDDDDY